MKISEAADILGLSGQDLTEESIKLAYRRASMKYHPDRGGSTEMMQAVNAAFAALEKMAGTTAPTSASEGYGEALNEALNAILTLVGLNIEVCGNWVWVSGDTKTHKEALKAAGYRWASKKFMWYFRPDDWTSSSRGRATIDEIREVYGSQAVKGKYATPLAA